MQFTLSRTRMQEDALMIEKQKSVEGSSATLECFGTNI